MPSTSLFCEAMATELPLILSLKGLVWNSKCANKAEWWPRSRQANGGYARGTCGSTCTTIYC